MLPLPNSTFNYKCMLILHARLQLPLNPLPFGNTIFNWIKSHSLTRKQAVCEDATISPFKRALPDDSRMSVLYTPANAYVRSVTPLDASVVYTLSG